MNNPKTGVVTWFDGSKGFGFIRSDGGGDAVFVHVTAAQRAGLCPPYEGKKITYEIVADDKTGRPRADNLRPAVSEDQ
jgi:cold shock protein